MSLAMIEKLAAHEVAGGRASAEDALKALVQAHNDEVSSRLEEAQPLVDCLSALRELGINFYVHAPQARLYVHGASIRADHVVDPEICVKYDSKYGGFEFLNDPPRSKELCDDIPGFYAGVKRFWIADDYNVRKRTYARFSLTPCLVVKLRGDYYDVDAYWTKAVRYGEPRYEQNRRSKGINMCELKDALVEYLEMMAPDKMAEFSPALQIWASALPAQPEKWQGGFDKLIGAVFG